VEVTAPGNSASAGNVLGGGARGAACERDLAGLLARHAPCGLPGLATAAWGAFGYFGTGRGTGVVQRALRRLGAAVWLAAGS
jgi:hypothetical protein